MTGIVFLQTDPNQLFYDEGTSKKLLELKMSCTMGYSAMKTVKVLNLIPGTTMSDPLSLCPEMTAFPSLSVGTSWHAQETAGKFLKCFFYMLLTRCAGARHLRVRGV